MNPLISVVVPVYNAEKYLSKCLDSLKNQTYKNLQIILINDGSKDSSEQICKQYAEEDNRFEFYTTVNQGSSEARNTGLTYVKGEYISFIDSDDFVSLDYFEVLYNLLEKNNADVSVCTFVEFDDPLKINPTTSTEEIIFESEDEIEEILLKFYDLNITFITPWAKLIKAEYFKDIRFPKGRSFDDEATMYKVFLKAKKVVYCPTQNYYYYYNTNSISHTFYRKNVQDFFPIYEERMVEYKKRNFIKAYTKTEITYFARLLIYYLWYPITNKKEILTKMKVLCKDLLNYDIAVPNKIKTVFFLSCPHLYLFLKKISPKQNRYFVPLETQFKTVK